jgi:uncharacterized protein involved in exopolysaccharide biosynthesis
MRKMIHFAVRLYPVRWRARYGPEFHALLEDMNAGFGDLLNIVKGALLMQIKWSNVPLMAAACGLLGIGVAALVSHATPRRYASTVVVSIENGEPALPQRVALVASRAFSDPALTSLIEKNELYPSERGSRSMADELHRFREDITVQLTTPKALQVSFSYPDSQKSQQVAGELMDRLMEANLVAREQEAEDERMNQQASPRDLTLPGERFRVIDLPHPVPVGANLIEVLSLGFGGGALAGAAIAMLRRRTQPSH